MTTAIGFALIGIAVVWFCFKLYVSYSSAGGTDFELPIYDGAIYPPILGTVGLHLVLRAYSASWPLWGYLALWLGSTALAALALRGMIELGDRPLR
jgi:hypothetical protein